ncbi:MAG TPA: DUF72 domain-containing protein [Candidatus Limnocylindrales bacterium]
MGEILIGTSSWADRLLLASNWYPQNVKTPQERLEFYGRRFPLVEVDTSFYAIPAPEVTTAWAQHAPDRFTFNIKAFSLFTDHSTKAGTLPADLRPAGAASEERLRRKDLSEEAYDELWVRFHESLAPLEEQGKLGTILLQFPPWLDFGQGARKRIAETAQRCQPFRVAVEFRNRSWFTTSNVEETLTFLAKNDISFCCVDMPQGHPSSVPPILMVTAEPAMVRFHGHSKEWTTGDKRERFRYAYSEDELTRWAARLRDLGTEASQVHVLFNNCCAGQAQRDAAALATILGVAQQVE